MLIKTIKVSQFSLGITIVEGALRDNKGCCMEILRFVIATRPIDFCFLEQFGIDNPREVDLEYLHSRSLYSKTKEVTNFQVIDIWLKIKPTTLNCTNSPRINQDKNQIDKIVYNLVKIKPN